MPPAALEAQAAEGSMGWASPIGSIVQRLYYELQTSFSVSLLCMHKSPGATGFVASLGLAMPASEASDEGCIGDHTLAASSFPMYWGLRSAR